MPAMQMKIHELEAKTIEIDHDQGCYMELCKRQSDDLDKAGNELFLQEVEMFEAGQASAIPRIRDLEARNAELEIWVKHHQECIELSPALKHELEDKNAKLEKHNKMLAHQLKYAENILTDVQADKFKLREKLGIVVEAFNKIDKANDCMKYFNNEIHVIVHKTREALTAIKEI